MKPETPRADPYLMITAQPSERSLETAQKDRQSLQTAQKERGKSVTTSVADYRQMMRMNDQNSKKSQADFVGRNRDTTPLETQLSAERSFETLIEVPVHREPELIFDF